MKILKKKLVKAATLAVLSTAFASSVSANTYIVQKGDTLSHIAIKYKTNVSEIKRLNQLNSDLIYINQKLVVSIDSGSNGGVAADLPSPGSVPVAVTASGVAVKTHTVVGGDTLSGIAKRHGISLAELMSWNNLSGHLIYPGNVLKVSSASGGGEVVAPVAPVNNEVSAGSGSGAVVDYLIKSGDSLSRIAVAHGTTVQKIKTANQLSSDLIYAGQTIKVPISGAGSSAVAPGEAQIGGGVVAPGGAQVGGNVPVPVPAPAPTSEVAKLIGVAQSVLGVPYAWGGTTPAGFDCSGYVFYVYNGAGKPIPRTSAEGYYNRSYYVTSPVPGDLLFFENTYKKGISHMGIYLGNNQFIHADSSGVRITDVNNSYYKQHFDGFKRFY